MSLRPAAVKLAATDPTLRKHLVPLLRRTVQAGGKVPPGAPRQVKQVAEAAIRNALEAAEEQIKDWAEVVKKNPSMNRPEENPEDTRKFWKERVYVHHERDRGKYEPEKFGVDAWVIADNFDRGPNLIYYTETDTWVYMPSYGSEKVMRGGFREALANAKIMYTG